MPDDRPTRDAGDGLAWLALLYASGELDPGEVTQFEQRLAGDQQAREALAQAVPLALPPGQTLAPDPAYRDRVRRRLRGRRSWGWLVQRRTYPGHPILWSGAGAAAAALVMAASFLLWVPASPGVQAPAGPPPEPAAAESREPVKADVASVWAQLHTTDHVAKAHDEEMRRKNRNDQRTRPAGATKGRDDHRTHPMSNQGNKH
jgi:hypothetical protein